MLIDRLNLIFRCHSDDTQLHLSIPPHQTNQLVKLEARLCDQTHGKTKFMHSAQPHF